MTQLIAPRLPCVLLAALTDLYTFKLAQRILPGRGEAAVRSFPSRARVSDPHTDDFVGQFFLSLTNLFHAHALTRALSTSAEASLTIIALYYWPFQSPATPIAGNKSHSRKIEFGRLALSLALSATAFILRPTNVVFWVVMGGELVIRVLRYDVSAGFKVILLATSIGFVF